MEEYMKEVLIVDEDEKTRRNIAQLVKLVRPDAVVYGASNARQAYAVATKRTIDMFITDIALHSKNAGPDHSGEELLFKIRSIEKYLFTPIIIVSRMTECKFRMFTKIHCYRFVEKPYDKTELRKIIESAIIYKSKNTRVERVFFRSYGIIEVTEMDKILYIKSKDHTVTVHTVDDCFEITYKSCNKILEKLECEYFTLCSKGTIINLKRIKSIDTSNRHIYLKGSGDVLEIGPAMKKRFLEEIKKQGIMYQEVKK